MVIESIYQKISTTAKAFNPSGDPIAFVTRITLSHPATQL